MFPAFSRPLSFSLASMVLLCSAACTSEGGSGGGGANASPHAHQTAVGLPGETGFPQPVFPAQALRSEEAFQLGRALFYERDLSGNGTQSCASCHQQEKAFTDGREVAVGSTGQLHPRNSPSLANVVYFPTLTWANPVLVNLDTQMLTPLFGDNPVEMGIHDANKAQVLQRLRSKASLVKLFEAAYPQPQADGKSGTNLIDFDRIVPAISAFMRALVSGNSKYDQYLQGRAQLSASELRGLAVFNGEKGECFHCHGSFLFNDQIKFLGQSDTATLFHNTGLYNIDGKGGFPFPNVGLIEFTNKASDMGKFRAASLRNVELTAPYMHDGSIKTLEDVVDFYAAGGRVTTSGVNSGDGRANPYKSDLIVPIDFTAQEKQDLIAFLKTLTDRSFVSNPRFADPAVAP